MEVFFSLISIKVNSIYITPMSVIYLSTSIRSSIHTAKQIAERTPPWHIQILFQNSNNNVVI